MRTYENQFRNFTLDVTIPEGFKDDSWGNDVCPSWYDAARGLKVYVDFSDPEMREMGEDTPRFTLWRTGEDGDMSDATFLLQTDDWAEILDAIGEEA